ncbi:hypothetical protein MRB53_012337 [Persea americana]|uniref:Uncharacterized protein n=1 Tax=Persea americana TaxID=3435 RepID=A0ACC2LXD5_PERAE|nr:hypothetical protein MRB53_012337 [Persea americana]
MRREAKEISWVLRIFWAALGEETTAWGQSQGGDEEMEVANDGKGYWAQREATTRSGLGEDGQDREDGEEPNQEKDGLGLEVGHLFSEEVEMKVRLSSMNLV